MSEQRRTPSAFRVETPEETPAPIRPPQAFGLDAADVVAASRDVFEEPDPLGAPPPPAPRRKGWLGPVFGTALGILVSLALGLWTDALVRDLFARAEWLGWFGLGAAGLAALALFAILGRELLALRRLALVEEMQQRAQRVRLAADGKGARALVSELDGMFAGRAEVSEARRRLDDLRSDVIDPDSLLDLAEVELLGPLDIRARRLVLDAAKRVSLVTAVSPRAVFDVAYVVWEASRLIRRLAQLYGGRPGTLGFFRLARSALAHLAVTGSIAAGDSVIHQLVGQGLAARLSAKLGEGVINGMMTARIGVAAMEAARPLPFSAVPRPGMGDFLTALGRAAERERDEAR